MADRNAKVPADHRIDFRFGINVGDIIIDGDDIFGDGVNVAARLQTLAEPGGICISAKVHSELTGKLDCNFEDRGLQRVKNIALPVRVYALETLAKGTATEAVRTSASRVAPVVRTRGGTLRAAQLDRAIRARHHRRTRGHRQDPARRSDHLRRRDRFSERVFVQLAPLSDPALVATTVARAVGLVVADERTALDLTVQALAGQRLLLVLDNCEHLLDAVDRVVAALRSGAAHVHILATSQEVLRQADEHVYRLGTLALPTDATVSSARGAGAVELFVARAQAAESRFVLNDETVGAVVEICRRLDGIPLAIELAAARVPLLGVEGVRNRLDERFRLLTAGSRVALRRHQTLRAALEWSYGLLSQPEQAMFDKLGVFSGSFSVESAQMLAADERIDEWEALDHLGALVDKSLVTVDTGGTARYRMLETTRAFALERLVAGGATAKTTRRHAEVVLGLFEGFYREVLQGTPSAQVVPKITPDLDNLRAALDWASAPHGDRHIAIALFGAAIAAHAQFHYAVLKAARWIENLSPQVDGSIPTAEAARFWLACADWGGVHSPVESIDYARRAIDLYGDLGDRLGSCRGWTILAYALMTTGRLDEAKRALQEALQLCEATWPPWHRALVDNTATLVLGQLGEFEAARGHAIAVLGASRLVSSVYDQCTAQTLLIDLDVATGHAAQAAVAASDMLARAWGMAGIRRWPRLANAGDGADECRSARRGGANIPRRAVTSQAQLRQRRLRAA